MTLKPGGTVAGRILDEKGHPLQGVRVLILGEDAIGHLATLQTAASWPMNLRISWPVVASQSMIVLS